MSLLKSEIDGIRYFLNRFLNLIGFVRGFPMIRITTRSHFFLFFFFLEFVYVCAVHRQKMWLKCLLTYQAPYCMNRYTIILKLKWTAKWRVMRSHCKIYFFFFFLDTIVSTYLFSFFKKCLQIYIAGNVGRTCISRIFFFFFFHCFLSTFCYRKRFLLLR